MTIRVSSDTIALVNTTDDLLSLSEAARRSGVHRITLRRWALDGLIASNRLPNGVVRIPASQVARLVEVQPARTATG